MKGREKMLQLILQPDLTSRFWRSPYVSELRKLEYENIAKQKGVPSEVHVATQCCLLCDAVCYLLADHWVANSEEKRFARVMMDGGEHEFLLFSHDGVDFVLQSFWQTHRPRWRAIPKETAALLCEGKPFDYAQITRPLGKREDYQEYEVYFPEQLLSVDASRMRYESLPR